MGNKRLCGGLIALGLLVCTLVGNPATLSAVAGARNPCLEPGNLTQNCGFDTFVDNWVGQKRYQIPTGWWYFVLAGDLEFRPADDTYWGAPSLWLLSDGVPFTAGIYQEVQVTPGVVYMTDIGWAAVTQSDFERKLGLDPTGGTNPLASTVIWSRSEWGMDKWPDLTVSARATGPKMTIFVWVHHPTAHGNDWIFLDAVGLWPDPSQPAATVTPVASATPTRKPPTQTPKVGRAQPARPTNTPTVLPSPTPTEAWTSTPTPTQTATPQPPTATSTWTMTPTPDIPTATPLPTRTPLPTVVPVVRLVPSPEERLTIEEETGGGENGTSGTAFLYVAVGALVAGIILVILVGWLWLRSRRSVDER
jgi:hypothetical protein